MTPIARSAPALFASLLLLASPAVAQTPLARFVKHGDTQQLIVDGKPFLILGGELGNSSASSRAYMAPVWPKLQQLGLNTVLAPVSWELIEPQEGRFDFSSVDALIQDARAHDQKLVLLWFGAWKNSMSSYAPGWVKRDQGRFPRIETSDGKGQEILTPFSPANLEADLRAFRGLMAHLKTADPDRTVIMIQVENEIGMIPEARDQSDLADRAWAGPVPTPLIQHLALNRSTLEPELRRRWEANGARSRGTWGEVFGSDAWGQEVFQAWSFASYVERLVSEGKAIHRLPMFVNAALMRPGKLPGEYPSAGPLPQVYDVWRAGAPSVDMLSPDIYFPNFVEWVGRYDRPGNPLFIPEAGQSGAPEAPANAFFAIGRHDSIGFSPFSIENISEPEAARLKSAYAVLESLSPLILQHRGQGTMTAVRAPVTFDGAVDESPQTLSLGEWRMTATVVDPWTPKDKQKTAAHGALVIQLGRDEFLMAGSGVTFTFATDGAIAGLESVWEGRYDDGRWTPGRLLNGDETHQGRHLRLPPDRFGVQRVKLYRYR
jgi:beta-galactosidase GanA